MYDYRVPNAPFRDRFLELANREMLDAAEVAHRAGWITNEGPNTKRVERALGLRPNTRGNVQDELPALNALDLMRALHLDPFECGL